MSDSNVLIVGAGISGLATAWWLAEQGIAVEVWESAATVGGKIESIQEQGYLSESAAGLLVNFRTDIDRLIEGCNLTNAKQQRPENLNRYVLHQGQLTTVPMSFSGIAKSPLWSHKGKLRLPSNLSPKIKWFWSYFLKASTEMRNQLSAIRRKKK